MKDPKNIEILNKLVMNYITLHGLQNVQLGPTDPFAKYFLRVLSGGMHPMGKGGMMYSISDGNISMVNKDFYVPNSILHPMIRMAYDFYQEIDDMDNVIHPMVKEQISYQLGEIKFNEFLESSVYNYKTCLFELLDNYNSKKEGYNQIKLDVFNIKMQEAVEIEDYEMAAELRDKIADLKKIM
jgi:hypothetical protein